MVRAVVEEKVRTSLVEMDEGLARFSFQSRSFRLPSHDPGYLLLALLEVQKGASGGPLEAENLEYLPTYFIDTLEQQSVAECPQAHFPSPQKQP